MIETTTSRWTTVGTAVRVLLIGEAIIFLLAALLHLGIQFPLGFSEPRIIPATIVEGLCGISLVVSAYAIFAHRTWAWPIAIATHAFAVAGVLLGITALTLGTGPSTEVNTIYHWVTLVVLFVVLALLATPGARAALGRSKWISRRGSKTVKSPGSFRNRPPRWHHLWRALAWVVCGILIIYMLGLLTKQEYFSFFETLVLVSILLAMLNTRLSDPAMLVNRTLVYLVVGMCLALIYQVGTTVLHFLLAPGWPRVMIGLFVLGMLAMVRPLLTRVQPMIDKRFYRRQHDAARAIDAFASTLREEIDLDQLSERLLTVVQQVVQPRTLSLWLDHRNPTHNESSRASTLARWRQNGRQHAEHAGEMLVSSEAAAESPAVSGPLEMNIVYDDPLVAYVLNTPGVVEIDRLRLDSPALRALQVAQVKLALPLVSQGELIGWLNLGPRLYEQEYAQYERRLLTNLASQVAPALRVAQMVHEQQVLLREHARVEQELRTAQFIQQAFLPKEIPNLPAWQLARYYQPEREVGGDFYDFLSFEDGQLGLVVGDVTDKGVPAALVMTTTSTMLRAAAQGGTSPGEVLARVNDLLYASIPSRMFVTCFYALLDPCTGKLRYANAGHDLPYRRQAGSVCEVRATGMPLGLMPGMHYEEQEVTLAPDEAILFYSDGLVEAHNVRREMFGFPRLRALIRAHPGGTGLIDFLLKELATFTGSDWEQEDDVTMVVLHRTALPSGEDTKPTDSGKREPDIEGAAFARSTLGGDATAKVLH
jgi:serine phosphatase RsbU (regulator of sigma subunit)